MRPQIGPCRRSTAWTATELAENKRNTERHMNELWYAIRIKRSLSFRTVWLRIFYRSVICRKITKTHHKVVKKVAAQRYFLSEQHNSNTKRSDVNMEGSLVKQNRLGFDYCELQWGFTHIKWMRLPVLLVEWWSKGRDSKLWSVPPPSIAASGSLAHFHCQLCAAALESFPGLPHGWAFDDPAKQLFFPAALWLIPENKHSCTK